MSVAGVDDAVGESAGRKRQPEANTEADMFDAAIIAAAKTHALAQFPREPFDLVAADHPESAQRGPGLQEALPLPPTHGRRAARCAGQATSRVATWRQSPSTRSVSRRRSILLPAVGSRR